MRKTASGYRLIFGYLGLFIAFTGITLLLPLLAIPAFPKEGGDWYCFFIPGMSAIALGIGLFSLIYKREKSQLGKHQDSVLLVLVWVSAILISSTPFLIKGNLSFTDAIFETTSAYATIGLTVFKPTDYSLHLFVLYRSFNVFFGGVGLILIVTSAISDRYGLKLYVAEGHNDKLMPNLAKSARLILSIYTGIILIGVGLLCLAGMPVFDSIVHSISAVATGGFSSKPEGLIAFKSSTHFGLVQIVLIFLMVAGAINFLIHLFMLTGKWKKVIKDCEIRLFIALTAIFLPLFCLSALVNSGWKNVGGSLAAGAFTYFSSFTTTGFTNVSSLVTLGQGVMFLVFIGTIVGGGMGSTAGGVKQYRFAVALKSFFWSTREKMSNPNLVFPHYIWRFGEQKEVDSKDSAEAFSYILLYVMVILFGSFLMTLIGTATFGENMFEFANAISSNGMSNGVTAAANDGVKWVLILGMFAGRLEILGIYFGIYRAVRDALGKETI